MTEDHKPLVHESDPVGICGHTGDLRHHFYLTTPMTVGELFETGAGIPPDLMASPNVPVNWVAVCDACAVRSVTSLKVALVRRLRDLRNDARGIRN